jgi:UDP-glucose 4-epimerase
MPVVVGRISNLYGPGQDLSKAQGLISRLAICALTQQPINVFVSLDTLRDYVHVHDAAEQILAWVGLARQDHSNGTRTVQTRIIASGESVSVAHVIRLTQTIVRRRIPVALGADRSAAAQGLDIRLVPSRDERLPRLPRTPLPVGIRSVIADVMQRRLTPSHHPSGELRATGQSVRPS